MPRSPLLTFIVIFQGVISFTSLITNGLLLLLIAGKLQIFSLNLTSLPPDLKGLVVLSWAISLFGIIVTYGLWHLSRWGWLGSLVFQILCLSNNGLAIAIGHGITSKACIATVVFCALFAALWLPSSRNAINTHALAVTTIEPPITQR